jgi:hypothetical protein
MGIIRQKTNSAVEARVDLALGVTRQGGRQSRRNHYSDPGRKKFTLGF